jgi:hypothetical protein
MAIKAINMPLVAGRWLLVSSFDLLPLSSQSTSISSRSSAYEMPLRDWKALDRVFLATS